MINQLVDIQKNQINKNNTDIYKNYLKTAYVKHTSTMNTTYKTYTSTMLQFFHYLSEYEDNIYILDPGCLDNIVDIIEGYMLFCKERGNSSQTINNKIVAISSFYLWSVKRSLLSHHPFQNKLDRLKITELDKRRKSYFLTTEEIITIRVMMSLNKKFNIQDKLIWELFLDCACRINAVQNLKLSQLDLEGNYFHNVIEKEGKIVYAYFYKKTKELLHEWLIYRKENNIESDYLLIAKYRGEYKQMCKTTIRDKVRKMGRLIGIPDLYPHTLRKTSINLMATYGSLTDARDLANHASSSTTEAHYVKRKSGDEQRDKFLALRRKSGLA